MPQDWESAYHAAILETDLDRIIGKIDSARIAICACLFELDATGEHGTGRQHLVDALSTLDLIRRVELRRAGSAAAPK